MFYHQLFLIFLLIASITRQGHSLWQYFIVSRTDFVFLAPNVEDMQILFYVLCRKWSISINSQKSAIVHFRPKGTSKTCQKFYVGNKEIPITSDYKCLGVVPEEHMTCQQAFLQRMGKHFGI